MLAGTVGQHGDQRWSRVLSSRIELLPALLLRKILMLDAASSP